MLAWQACGLAQADVVQEGVGGTWGGGYGRMLGQMCRGGMSWYQVSGGGVAVPCVWRVTLVVHSLASISLMFSLGTTSSNVMLNAALHAVLHA